MLNKLAFKNAEKNIRDYAIYFFTLALGVCVFYMFNSIYAQQAMMELSAEQTDSVKAIQGLLSYVSLFVAVVLGFLIVYANSFFIRRRKKELGIYMTLGMDKHRISTILILETSVTALLSLGIGLMSGIILSQFMSIFTARMFEFDMTKYAFVFSPSAFMKSIFYFCIIFLIIIVFNSLTISRLKLIDLLYGGNKNETQKIQNIRCSYAIFLLSLILLGIAYYLIVTNGMFFINTVFLTGIASGTIGTLLFFYSLSGIMSTLVKSNRRLYFHNLTMFLTRQLGSKINTNFLSITVVCIVLLMTIGIFSLGYSMQSVLSTELRNYARYDCTFYDTSLHNENNQASFSGLKEYLDENSNVARYQTYYIYDMKQRYTELGVTLPEDAAFLKEKVLNCITLSEYNEAIMLQGMEALSLSDDSYLMLTNYSLMTDLAEAVYAARSSIFIDGQYLLPAGTITGSVRNGLEGILIIVPDKYAKKLPSSTAVLNVNCKDSAAADHFLEQLTEFDTSVAYAQKNYTEFSSRAMIYAEASTQKAVLAYIAIYLGIIFMMTCAAILAIQQLADTADNKYRYDLLKKLGAEKKLLNKTLFVQIGCYFLFPLVLAVLHSIFGLWAANDALRIYGDLHIGAGITATAIFVGILYSIYFLLTYIGSKNVINKNN